MSDETPIQSGATGGFGAFTGWQLTSDEDTMNKDRINALGSTGDEVAHKLINERNDFTSVYTCTNATNTVPEKIGAVVNGRALTGIAIATSNKAPATMTLTGHQHAANLHADTLRQVAHGITVGSVFGAIDFMGGTGAAGSDVVSGSVSITCTHLDKEDANGDHLVGDNFTAMISAQTTWTGEVTTPAAAGWDVTSVPVSVQNVDFIGTSVSGIKTAGVMTEPA